MFSSKTSILKKILIPVLLVMIVQATLLYGFVLLGGPVTQLENNSFAILEEVSSSRKKDLENLMIQRWSNVGTSVTSILEKTQKLLQQEEKSFADLQTNDGLSEKLLSQVYDDLFYLLRRNSVTGAFLILNRQNSENMPGLYFRDPDPNSNPSDYSDLLALRAPSAVTKQLNLAMDSLWHPQFHFSGGPDLNCNRFFYAPFSAALEHPEIGWSDLGYWYGPFYMDEGDINDTKQILTYSVPLISPEGTPFGILGIELSVDYLAKLLPAQEIYSGEKSGYILAMSTDGNTYIPIVESGSYIRRMLANQESFAIASDSEQEGTFILKGLDKDTIYGIPHSLQLYNSHTPFEEDHWVLIGASSRDVLLEFSQHFKYILFCMCIFTFLIGIIGLLIVAKRLSRPIESLAQQLRNTNPHQSIMLDKVNIYEIDELCDSIQYLSKQVIDFSTKLSTILKMAKVSIGAFEYVNSDNKKVFCTDQFFSILNRPDIVLKDQYVDTPVFEAILNSLEGSLQEHAPDRQVILYRLEADEAPRWVRLALVYESDRVLGVVTDVTQEILEKEKLEHERDYDLLTNVKNRRAFIAMMQQLFAAPKQLQISALIMLDLDNLKFINDTYGHDYGDEYIRSAADGLKKYAPPNTVISRLSGDEFIAFLYGYQSQEQIRAAVEKIQQGLQQTRIYLPDHTQMQIRASAGISWYPQDSTDYEELIRYADFAMYRVKHTDKGQFTEFNFESYNKEAYLLQCREELNIILENSLVDYQFQPIINARTGTVFAFEALMRPCTDNIKTPVELISLARSQSKLPQIERLTFFKAMECFLKQDISKSNCKIFINSIPNQLLSVEDLQKFEETYGEYLSRIVVELTEVEQTDKAIISRKRSYLSRWHAEMAIDDFGVGYNGEALLVDMDPQYLKVDISIVRNIHTDKNRQQVLQNLVSYSKKRGIYLIAEGAETREEVEALISSGVDYIQGYYLGKPTYQPRLVLEDRSREILEINAAFQDSTSL